MQAGAEDLQQWPRRLDAWTPGHGAHAGRLDAWTRRAEAVQHKKAEAKKTSARLRPRRICNGYNHIIIIMVP